MVTFTFTSFHALVLTLLSVSGFDVISPALLDSKLARYGSSSQIATPLRTRCYDWFMFAFTRRSSDSVTRLSFILLFSKKIIKLESRTFPQTC